VDRPSTKAIPDRTKTTPTTGAVSSSGREILIGILERNLFTNRGILKFKCFLEGIIITDTNIYINKSQSTTKW